MHGAKTSFYSRDKEANCQNSTFFQKKKKTIYLPCIYSDKCLKSAVVSRISNSLNGVNYNNTATISLILIIFILSPQQPIPIGFQFRKYLRIWKIAF